MPVPWEARANGPMIYPGPPYPPRTQKLVVVAWKLVAVGYSAVCVAGVVFYVAGVASRQAPWCSRVRITNGVTRGPGPPRPQQPIGCQMWALCVAGVVFYMAGVVFGGQQTYPEGSPRVRG